MLWRASKSFDKLCSTILINIISEKVWGHEGCVTYLGILHPWPIPMDPNIVYKRNRIVLGKCVVRTSLILVCDQFRLNPISSASEISQNVAI